MIAGFCWYDSKIQARDFSGRIEGKGHGSTRTRSILREGLSMLIDEIDFVSAIRSLQLAGQGGRFYNECWYLTVTER